jgi:hypothetical protein
MGKFAILAQKAIFTEGVGSTSGLASVVQQYATWAFFRCCAFVRA